MITLNATQIITQEYKGSRNFMTSQVLKYGKITVNMAYELSRDKGIFDESIWGVTIVTLNSDNTTTREQEKSQLFHSLVSACDYIEKLKVEYNTSNIDLD